MDRAELEAAVLPHFRRSCTNFDYHKSRIDQLHVGNYIRSSINRVQFVCQKVAAAVPPGASVLEVGTAYGLILLSLRQAGYHVAGTDLSINVGVYCHALVENGIEVYHWDLHHPESLRDSSYDVVIASEVLEHLQISPSAALQSLGRTVKPGGTIIVTTPNIYCLDNLKRIVKGDNICESFPAEAAMIEGVVVDARTHPREPTLSELIQAANENAMTVVEGSYFEARQIFTWRRKLVSQWLPCTRDSLLLVATTSSAG